MQNPEYPGCITELYQSEVLGEKAFLALINIANNDREKYHIGTVLQLETETKARLRPFMLKHGFDLVENPGAELVDQIVTAYRENDWLDFLTGLRPLVDDFVARFKEIALAGPAEDQEILQSMVAHEEAFVSWIEKEAAGEADSLGAIISQLQYPLTAP
jgi:hypothetical protein